MKINRSWILAVEMAISVCLMSGAAYAHNHDDNHDDGNVILKESRTLQPVKSQKETNTHQEDSAYLGVDSSFDAINRTANSVEASSTEALARNASFKNLVDLLNTLRQEEGGDDGEFGLHCDNCSHSKHYVCGSGSDCVSSHRGTNCWKAIQT